MRKVFTRKIVSAMWALGMPTQGSSFADIVRGALRAGLNDRQAFQLAKLAYYAAAGYEWQIPDAAQQLQRATKQRNAEQHPNGKDAEDLAAECEGRPSRWGTPAFHRAS